MFHNCTQRADAHARELYPRPNLYRTKQANAQVRQRKSFGSEAPAQPALRNKSMQADEQGSNFASETRQKTRVQTPTRKGSEVKPQHYLCFSTKPRKLASTQTKQTREYQHHKGKVRKQSQCINKLKPVSTRASMLSVRNDKRQKCKYSANISVTPARPVLHI